MLLAPGLSARSKNVSSTACLCSSGTLIYAEIPSGCIVWRALLRDIRLSRRTLYPSPGSRCSLNLLMLGHWGACLFQRGYRFHETTISLGLHAVLCNKVCCMVRIIEASRIFDSWFLMCHKSYPLRTADGRVEFVHSGYPDMRGQLDSDGTSDPL